jgi:AbrB family looped-hinge helix DNA binding protein
VDDNAKRVSEALLEYVTDPPITTMSSKRQITLPAEIVRRLGLKPGAKLAVYVQDDQIVLQPRTKTWLEIVTGPPYDPNMRTKEDVDAYLRDVREGLEERAQRIEGDAYIAPDED